MCEDYGDGYVAVKQDNRRRYNKSNAYGKSPDSICKVGGAFLWYREITLLIYIFLCYVFTDLKTSGEHIHNGIQEGLVFF